MRKLGAAKLPVLTGLLLLAVLLTGCISADLTQFQGELERRELKSGTLAVTAITCTRGEAPQADALARKIKSRFRKARPWLNLLPLASVRTNFSTTEYQQTLQIIGEREDWSPIWLADFSRLTNHARFVLLTHLHTRVEIAMDDGEGSWMFDLLWNTFVQRKSSDDDEWDEEEEEEADPVPYRKRTLETRMGIYDLHARRMVWLATCRSIPRAEPIREGDSMRAEDDDKPADSESFKEALRTLCEHLPK